jgi:hypothetical protein
MSVATPESLSQQWGSGDFNHHLEHAAIAQEVFEDNLVLQSTDRRWQLLQQRMNTAHGSYDGIQVLGEYGAMKTTAGNLLIGPNNRVDVHPTDTAGDFYGSDNLVRMHADSPKFIPGKIAEAVDPEMMAIHIGEAGHLRNQTPLGSLYESGARYRTGDGEGDYIEINGAVYYITRNFPNGHEVHELNQNLNSRNPNQIIVGDVSEDFAKRASGAKEVDFSRAPLLPKAAIRKEIAGMVNETYFDPEVQEGITASADFTVDLIQKLNQTGLTNPIGLSDMRRGKAMAKAGRAYLFDQDVQSFREGSSRPEGKKTPLDKLTIARVAAFVLPTAVILNPIAEENFQNNHGRSPSALEKAVAVRRIIASTAIILAYEDTKKQMIESAVRSNGAMAVATPQEMASIIEDETRRHTYADVDFLGYNVAESYADHGETGRNDEGRQHGFRNRFKNRRSSRS